MQHQAPLGIDLLLNQGKSGIVTSARSSKNNACGGNFSSRKITTSPPNQNNQQKVGEQSDSLSDEISDDDIERDRYGKKGLDGQDETSNESDDEDDNGMEELLLLDDAGQEQLDEQDVLDEKKTAEE